MPEPVGRPGPQRTATQTALVESFGGRRGLLDSGLPAVVFVLVNALVDTAASRDTALRAALVSAVATGLAVIALRLVRRETLQQAVSGFLGLAVPAWFAFRSGEARDFFLPGIWINIAYGAGFLLSALAGYPVVGAVIATVEGLGTRWRTDPQLRRAFALATVGWAVLVFGLRAAVQGTLYVADQPGALAVARLLLGWPLTILAVAVTLLATRRVRARAVAERDAGQV